MHAVRDPCGDGGEVRRVPRTGLLLTPSGEWWESYFDSLYLREYSRLFDPRLERRFIGRLIARMGLPVGARVLDCPCGQGRHARLLAEAGLLVDGLDLSPQLLAVARKAGPRDNPTYTRADMRELPRSWTGSFSAVLNLFTSFGFFRDPEDDERVIAEFSRVLAPGGILIWHGGNRDFASTRLPLRDWWVARDSTLFAQERSFEPLTGVLTVRTRWRFRNDAGEREHRIRMYTATRLAELMAENGLSVESALDGDHDRPLGRGSRTMLLVARKGGDRP